MTPLFTRRERIVLWVVVVCVLGLSLVRLLHARHVIDLFRRGEIIRTLPTE